MKKKNMCDFAVGQTFYDAEYDCKLRTARQNENEAIIQESLR